VPGDALDHAIFTRERSSKRCAGYWAPGLLWVSDDGKFGLTPTGRDLLGRRKGEWFRQVDSVLGLLRNGRLAWSITEEEVRSAYVSYMQSGEPDTRGP